MTDTSTVSLERLPGYTALVTLNRPHVRNAIDSAVAARLEVIVDETERDPDIRAVVITGAGSGVFCAGADLKEVAAGRQQSLFTERGGFAGFVRAVRTKPWIAAVNGKALAGGFEIVLACDLVVAATGGAFGLPEVTRGLVAAAGGVHRLPRVFPRNLALQAILTGDTIDVQTALQYGIVNRLVPEERVVGEALDLAARITRHAPLAVRESLAIARRSADLDDAELHNLSKEAFDRVVGSEDCLEGARAFVEKRQPHWRGR